MTEYGLVVAVPTSVVVPDGCGVSKNSTLVIDAVGSLALAVIVTSEPGVNDAPRPGW